MTCLTSHKEPIHSSLIFRPFLASYICLWCLVPQRAFAQGIIFGFTNIKGTQKGQTQDDLQTKMTEASSLESTWFY